MDGRPHPILLARTYLMHYIINFNRYEVIDIVYLYGFTETAR
jgi:hypothetical protein